SLKRSTSTKSWDYDGRPNIPSDAIFDGDRGSALGSDSHSMTKSDCRLDNRLSLQGFLLPWASAEAPWPSRKKALGENCRYHWLAAEVR
ncbi:MAG TPA: hypothetical protein VEF36_14080, partial [Roseiarcus sp.]|nr:hypothetical protein [Roseiarcus sp.]